MAFKSTHFFLWVGFWFNMLMYPLIFCFRYTWYPMAKKTMQTRSEMKIWKSMKLILMSLLLKRIALTWYVWRRKPSRRNSIVLNGTLVPYGSKVWSDLLRYGKNSTVLENRITKNMKNRSIRLKLWHIKIANDFLAYCIYNTIRTFAGKNPPKILRENVKDHIPYNIFNE